MGLFSGLGKLGLNGLDGLSVYGEPEKPQIPVEEEKEPEAPKIVEEDFLLKKTCKCPSCTREFKTLAVKAGKAKLVGTDKDLRPRYDGIEPLKYEVTMCPVCGYASLNKDWGMLTDNQCKNVRKEISASFRPDDKEYEIYSYDDALKRYQMALANSIVKQSKNSDKALICLKAGWLLRSKWESLDPEAENYPNDVSEAMGLESEFLENALEGLMTARANEAPPICGMDELTVDYLIAALSVRFEKYEQAAKLISKILQSRAINSRMKEKTLELKDEILKARSTLTKENADQGNTDQQ